MKTGFSNWCESGKKSSFSEKLRDSDLVHICLSMKLKMPEVIRPLIWYLYSSICISYLLDLTYHIIPLRSKSPNYELKSYKLKHSILLFFFYSLEALRAPVVWDLKLEGFLTTHECWFLARVKFFFHHRFRHFYLGLGTFLPFKPTQ